MSLMNGTHQSENVISSDDDLNTELSNAEDLIGEVVDNIEAVDYAEALDLIGQAQEIINRAHTYISGKIE